MHTMSDMQTSSPDYLGTVQVCELAGFDRSTLSRWIKDGTAKPAMQLPGKNGAFLFTREEAERLAALFIERTQTVS